MPWSYYSQIQLDSFHIKKVAVNTMNTHMQLADKKVLFRQVQE